MNFGDETYTATSKEFVVDFPVLLHINAKDTIFPQREYVDFFIGSGYWTPMGLYSIEWLKLPGELTVEQFHRAAPEIAKEHADKRFSSNGKFTIVEQNSDKKANSYVVLADGIYKNVPSTWIFTIQWHHNRIAFLSKVLPKDNHLPISELGENTESYQKWVNSFKKL